MSDPDYQWDFYQNSKQHHQYNIDNYNNEFINSGIIEQDDFINNNGPLYNKRMIHMDSAEQIAINSGWLKNCIGEKPEVESPEPITPQTVQSASTWKNIVMEVRNQILMERNKNISSSSNNQYVNERKSSPFVDIVNFDFLQKLFNSDSKKDLDIIDKISSQFSLNEEQERAYRIITQHVISKSTGKLRMYLGGMGGTGKTQVIKALMCFFEQRGELHRIIAVAPTGSAAALIGGSTYHSVFGIHENYNSKKTLSDVKARLDGVDYIFFDEVSMLSCRNMYKISSQLSKALNVFDEPLGGLNFIFAGDFAQLPPPGDTSLYGLVKSQSHSRMSIRDQQSAIGKAIWHQITTVVILRKNMRQQKQSVDDSKLRTCLENMRYKSCTKKDIDFLKSRIASINNKNICLASKNFRNVSIITAWNAQKDRLNELGCKHFASENNRPLFSFYCINDWKFASKSIQQKYNVNNNLKSSGFPLNLQKIL